MKWSMIGSFDNHVTTNNFNQLFKEVSHEDDNNISATPSVLPDGEVSLCVFIYKTIFV